MVEGACRIEDVLKEQGILAKTTTNNGGQNNNNTGHKDKKNSYWNKNKQVVNDGVVDSPQPKNDGVLNISSAIQDMKLQTTQQGDKPKYQKGPKQGKRQFTKLGDSYADIFKLLIAHNWAQPQDPANHHIPNPKPYWWDEKAYCVYHNGIGHNIKNCFKIKHIVQDLIDNGQLTVDGLTTNADHRAFKEPLPKYEKGENSKSGGAAVNYTYPNAENVINMLEVVYDNVNMVKIKDTCESDVNSTPKSDERPILVLRGPHSQKISQPLNAVTRGQAQAPIVIRGPTTSKNKQPVSKGVIPKPTVDPRSNYDLVEQLQRTPAQISIFELLEISPRHKHVLEDALRMENVPNNIDIDQF